MTTSSASSCRGVETAAGSRRPRSNLRGTCADETARCFAESDGAKRQRSCRHPCHSHRRSDRDGHPHIAWPRSLIRPRSSTASAQRICVIHRWWPWPSERSRCPVLQLRKATDEKSNDCGWFPVEFPPKRPHHYSQVTSNRNSRLLTSADSRSAEQSSHYRARPVGPNCFSCKSGIIPSHPANAQNKQIHTQLYQYYIKNMRSYQDMMYEISIRVKSLFCLPNPP